MLPFLTIKSLCEQYEAKTFTQTLDHANPGKTFSQKYFVSTDHGKKSDYLIVYIGEFTSLSASDLTDSPMNRIANNTQSPIVALENRYFGNSIPTDDLSTENLKYNTIDQHLDDIKEFIIAMKKEYCNDASKCRVATIGRGFGASLATWIHMQKGKELNIVGTWSSSAFLLSDPEFLWYDHHEAVAMTQWGNCYQYMMKAYKIIDDIAYRKDDSTVAMQERFGLNSTSGLKDLPTDFNHMFTEAISRGMRLPDLYPEFLNLCNRLNTGEYTEKMQY